MSNPTIILASGSPRRREVLAKSGLDFSVVESEYEEDMTLDLAPDELVRTLSHGKAREVTDRYPDDLVIGADSIVAHQGRVLGKPKSKEEAQTMLQQLSGSENDIVTGVTIIDGSRADELSFAEHTRVSMKPFSDATIDAYIATGEPMDKAGAYALQERGTVLVEKIEGDFYNAMGLPLSRLADELPQFGVSIL